MPVYGMEIDDVIQEMYARIVSQPCLEAIRHPRQYAIQTATGIIIDHIRRSRVISIHATGSLDQLEISTQEASPEQLLEFREEIAAVVGALALLPQRTREVLILRRVEGLSQLETAGKLGISVKTVEKHMALGVAALMASFGRGGKSPASTSISKLDENHDDQTLLAGD